MSDYKQSTLWKTAFTDQEDGFDAQRRELVGAYEKFRERVAFLLAQIQRELPDLTLHDITHVDALWRVASEIAGPNYPLNPCEALVLGGAFLLHDAAHCRAAYPGGINELRETIEWRDAAAQRGLPLDQLTDGSATFQSVLFDTLRVLHPKQARHLPFAKWSDGYGDQLHLFPHDELRDAYGHVMGEIAESHWHYPHELEPFAARTVTTAVCLAPARWTVNLLKIAVLLRVADAAHIDAKRAPRILLAMNRPNGISQEHWRFQERLNQPQCDTTRAELVFSSRPFPAAEQEAWWLAFDAARLTDKELSAASHLIRDHALPPLAAREVRGIRSPESFASQVPTQGWHPVDASLRISDIRSVVERFGGAKLYGDNPQLALRELLQNARDAVMASRALGALGETEGSITVQLEERNGEDWLHVTDTGIGMSRYVLVNVLLDFGRSLWKDGALRNEWPGLAATGFDAVGQFGIGFFSVFMLGQHVKVVTHRQTGCNGEPGTQWVLEFPHGLDARPSLRVPVPNERLPRHGTRVSICLWDNEKLLQPRSTVISLRRKGITNDVSMLTLAQTVGALAPALDIDVFTQAPTDERPQKTITAGDWRDLHPHELLRRIAPAEEYSDWAENYLNQAAKHLLPMKECHGELAGRCAITSNRIYSLSKSGVITVGGLFGSYIREFAGILIGKQTELLNRSVAIPSVSADILSAWATKQADLLKTSDQLTWDACASLLVLGAQTDELLVAIHDNTGLTSIQLKATLGNLDEIWLIEGRYLHYDSDADEVLKSEFDADLKLDSRVLAIGLGASENQFISESRWPSPFFKDQPTQPAKLLETLINQVWPECVAVTKDEHEIGNVNGVPIYREVQIVYRTEAHRESAD